MIRKENVIPVIYLDTNVMIEFSKCAQDKCTDSHKDEIGRLYDMLRCMMKDGQVFCPLGNQLREMGMSKGRSGAKDFLLRFVNLYFKGPDEIEKYQMKVGYRAFIANENSVKFDENAVISDEQKDFPFFIHVAPVYSQDRVQVLKEQKLNTIDSLNKAKENRHDEPDFCSQLKAELLSDFSLFVNAIQHFCDSQEAFERLIEEIGKMQLYTGNAFDVSTSEGRDAICKYMLFLSSELHHALPYKRIESVLWAHRMQQSNKIVQGDPLDIKWASAYLPFVDYAVTDAAFCDLLNSSGLAKECNVKVYSLRTIDKLIEELPKRV